MGRVETDDLIRNYQWDSWDIDAPRMHSASEPRVLIRLEQEGQRYQSRFHQISRNLAFFGDMTGTLFSQSFSSSCLHCWR